MDHLPGNYLSPYVVIKAEDRHDEFGWPRLWLLLTDEGLEVPDTVVVMSTTTIPGYHWVPLDMLRYYGNDLTIEKIAEAGVEIERIEAPAVWSLPSTD